MKRRKSVERSRGDRQDGLGGSDGKSGFCHWPLSVECLSFSASVALSRDLLAVWKPIEGTRERRKGVRVSCGRRRAVSVVKMVLGKWWQKGADEMPC